MKVKTGMGVLIVIIAVGILSCSFGRGEAASRDATSVKVDSSPSKPGVSQNTGDERVVAFIRDIVVSLPPRHLGSGTHRVAVGLIKDASDNIVSGIVKIFQGSRLIGETGGGFFSLYDLPAGDYTLEFIPSNICTTVGRSNFRIEDPLGRTETVINLNLDLTVTAPEPALVTPGGTNLGAAGRNLIFQGRTTDERGRLLDGVVKVFQGDIYLGYSMTSGGRFQIYDIASGTYFLEFEPISTIAASSGLANVTARVGETRTVVLNATHLE